MSFRLSAELDGHSADVRGLASRGSDTVLSVSRDATGRIWTRAGPSAFAEDSVLLGHSGNLTAVVAVPPTADHPHGLVATGGADKTICLWDCNDPSQPLTRLEGHTDNVCALAASADGRMLVSGSWDKTARVWVDGACQHVLRGHQYAVWGVLVLDDGSVLTASADKLIRRWVDGTLTQTYAGHTDCVRCLAKTADGFASGSNDGSVRLWSLDGQCRAELYGHTSFVYAIDALPDGSLVTGGEDRSVRVWRGSELVHTVFVPSTSVWAVTALANGDIACGTNDGRVRVFTLDPERVAAAEQLEAFEQSNASYAMSSKTMGGVDTAKLPGPERLDQPGDRDQQVIMVKDGTAVAAYQWEQRAGKWSKVGEVVDAVGQSRKQVYEGREYDYVFDVDIREGAPPLKLPFNATQNPYSAAQAFLERNQLSLDHLDTVADFIIKNADGVQIGADSHQAYADPFTGGNRYVPGQAAGSGATAAAPDPFTGGKRYVPAGGSAAYVPPTTVVVNRKANGAAIVAKLAEFNALLAQDADTAALAADQADMALVGELGGLGGSVSVPVSQAAYGALLRIVRRWPVARRFPALDLLRLAAADSPVPATFRGEDGSGLVAVVGDASGLFAVAAGGANEVNAMMGARALANACVTAEGAATVWAARKDVLAGLEGAWTAATNKNLVTALSTVYLNLAILATQKGDDDDGLEILSPASRFLGHTDHPDAQLRLINVFGVLASKFQLCKDSARVLGDEAIVILGIQGTTDALRQAAKDVGTLLTTK
ncbi:WD repeat protein Lub1 [Coemansia spiralis]|nr:WD repeat protein Lub1 [Coemansia spiralis]